MLATRLALSLSPSVTPISAPGFGGGTWPHKVTHDDDRKLFVMRGQHGTGRVPISARTQRRHACMHREEQVAQQRAPSPPPAHVCPTWRARTRERLPRAPAPRCSSPSVTYALAQGATQRSIGLRKAIKKASLEHALACATKSAHAGASPSVARACLAMRLSSPQKLLCSLASIKDNLRPSWADDAGMHAGDAPAPACGGRAVA